MFWKRLIGIDFGTYHSRIILPEGVIYEEPTLIARNKKLNKVVAIGSKAEELLGKTPKDIELIRPIENGVITNLRAAEYLLRHMISTVSGNVIFTKPTIVINIPTNASSVEIRALEEVALAAGAGDVLIYPNTYLAALGSEFNIEEPFGLLIVDIGAGTTETAIISYGGIVISDTTKIASHTINENLNNFLKKNYGIIVGDLMLDKIKHQIASASENVENIEVEIRGRDISSGLPKSINIRTYDILDVVTIVLEQIILHIKGVLEKSPPELSSDIVDTGIILTGGGAKLRDIETVILKSLGLPVVKLDDVDKVVSNGIRTIVKDLDRYAYRNRVN
ncbi:MAG: rod shape-determining protein [Candidatus Dojkabacteria bacterium]|nr:rod shape-determining protein [Candidatus Dojkabacteria bacterium]